MTNFKNKNILLTQGELIDYAGSEIVTLELAEYFSAIGANVSVFANYIGDPIKKEFEKITNVKLFTDSKEIKFESLNLIWVHHQLIPPGILQLKLQNKLKAKIVFHHMFPFQPLEYPFHPHIEKFLADGILYNSAETKKAIETDLADLNFMGEVLNNPAPDVFYVNAKNRKYNKTIKKVIVVSNHIPNELTEAINLLLAKNINVQIFGVERARNYTRVRPRHIAAADVVITIGKTVQYAILSGTPVYCYDQFGGPGYLSKSNIYKADHYNFSGRGFASKSAKIIAEEIVSGYHIANIFAEKLNKSIAPRYRLSDRIGTIVNSTSTKKNNPTLTQSQISAFEASNKNLWAFHSQFHNSRFYLSNKIDESQQNINEQNKIIDSLKIKINNYENSTSWRITRLVRALGNLLNKYR